MDRLPQSAALKTPARDPTGPSRAAGGKPAKQSANKFPSSIPLGVASKGSLLHSGAAVRRKHAQQPMPQRSSTVPSALQTRAPLRFRGPYTFHEIQNELEAYMKNRQVELDAADPNSLAAFDALQRAGSLFLKQQKDLLDHNATQLTNEEAYRNAAWVANELGEPRSGGEMRVLKLVTQELERAKSAKPAVLSEPSETNVINQPNKLNDTSEPNETTEAAEPTKPTELTEQAEQAETKESNNFSTSASPFEIPGKARGSSQGSAVAAAKPSRPSRASTPPLAAPNSVQRRSLLPQRRASVLASYSSPCRIEPSELGGTSTPTILVTRSLLQSATAHRRSLLPKPKPGDGN